MVRSADPVGSRASGRVEIEEPAEIATALLAAPNAFGMKLRPDAACAAKPPMPSATVPDKYRDVPAEGSVHPAVAETKVAPAAHTEQPAAPPYEYEFDAHGEHAVALEEYCPAGQGEQEDAPAAGAM
jgi:hypothetical protein